MRAAAALALLLLAACGGNDESTERPKQCFTAECIQAVPCGTYRESDPQYRAIR